MEESLKKYIYISTFIYIVVLIISIFILPSIFGNIYGNISSEQLRINSINNSELPLLQTLLIRNIMVSCLIIFLGVIGSEILPLAILTWNAISFGEILNALNKPETINAIYFLLPHSIIELPATILCTAFACNFALKMRNTSGNNGVIGVLIYKGSINKVLTEYLVKPYIYYILPMIIVGCIIESTISLYIMRAIFNG